MTKLIDHMLDFARLEMKSGKYAEEAVDMEELVASICSDMSANSDAHTRINRVYDSCSHKWLHKG